MLKQSISHTRGGPALVLMMALVLTCSRPSLAANKHEPNGLGKLRFGMTPAQVLRLYPALKKLDQENLGASPVISPLAVRQLLSNQKVPGLKKPVLVELRYWKEKLWVIVVYFGQNPADEVMAALKKQYGEPSTSSREPVWRGKKANVMTNLMPGWYAIADNELSRDAQEVIIGEIRKNEERMRAQQEAQRLQAQAAATAAAAATPAPTPGQP